jgi:hypothetical protein
VVSILISHHNKYRLKVKSFLIRILDCIDQIC